MKIMRLMTAALFASAAALSAQEDSNEPFKPYFAFGFAFAQGHAHDMTQKTWGGLGAYAAEAGLEFDLPNTKARLRPNFGMARILSGPPTASHPDLYDLMGIYVGFDMVFEPFKQCLPGLTLTAGPSFHTWNVDKVNAFGDPSQGYKGMKLGWRLGAGYRINQKFSVIMDFTQTEWRSIREEESTEFIEGFNPSRPAYFTIKGAYRF
jgi:hypothetical protein